MSQSEGDDEVNRREVAYRLFAAEFDDADFSYAESDEERAPNYVVAPTGARVNRVFVVGVLTEVEDVNEDVVRARVVDPTGAFVVYAGQYQPEALAALESAETPSFVAVTGKARTFQPDDADVVYTSIRPETVTEVDAATRDRWVVTTAEQTADRVSTMAAAHERVERDDRLREALTDAGVEPGLAAGIPLALDHYDTSPAYLAAVRDLAVGAAEVVAGDADSAGSLDLAPSDGGDVPLDFAADLDADVHSEPAAAESTDASAASTEETGATAEDTETAGEPESEAAADADPNPEPAAETPEPSEVAAEAEPDDEEAADESEAAEPETEESELVDATSDDTDDELAAADADAAADDGEMYELSEEEREEVKDEYGVDFSTGSEVPEPGEADIDAPGPDEGIEPAAGAEATANEEPPGGANSDDEDDDLGDFDAGDDEPFDPDDRQETVDEDDVDDPDDFTERAYDEPESDAEDAEAGSMDLDLEDYVVELMDELDDGDGAPRDEVIAAATDERDADEGDIEDAIQDALMSGQCYESGDDHLKAI